MILLCLESLLLKHLRLPYPCRFIWQEKFWRYLLPHIRINLQVSIFCLGLLVTKFLPNLICLGKQGKMGNKNSLRKEKNMRFSLEAVNSFRLECQKCLRVWFIRKKWLAQSRGALNVNKFLKAEVFCNCI